MELPPSRIALMSASMTSTLVLAIGSLTVPTVCDHIHAYTQNQLS